MAHTSAAPAPATTLTQAPAAHRARVDITEKKAWYIPGGLMLLLSFLILGGIGYLYVTGIAGLADAPGNAKTSDIAFVVIATVALFVWLVMVCSFAVISPGETRVVQFFGRYVGTVRRTGLVCTAPLTSRKTILVRVRNFETNELKVNDADGNPINIAAIIVWQVSDTARAAFAVDDYVAFVQVQAEAALRHVAMSHPYDAPEAHNVQSLRGSTDEISEELATEVGARVAVAGVEIVEVRISNLAYAPEIAQAMLQRQQAGAIIAAREKIVEGAVTMVEQALARLEEQNIVTLDDERRATMVSNLLVVLCGESRATPVINTGSLYS